MPQGHRIDVTFVQSGPGGGRRYLSLWTPIALGALALLLGALEYWRTHRSQPEPLREHWFQGVQYERVVRDHPRPVVAHVVRIDLDAPGIDRIYALMRPLAGGARVTKTAPKDVGTSVRARPRASPVSPNGAMVAGMSALKARVENGRLKLDEPTDLPEGTVVPLEIAGDWDDLDDAERADLHAALREGFEDARAGRSIDAAQWAAELRSRL